MVRLTRYSIYVDIMSKTKTKTKSSQDVRKSPPAASPTTPDKGIATPKGKTANNNTEVPPGGKQLDIVAVLNTLDLNNVRTSDVLALHKAISKQVPTNAIHQIAMPVTTRSSVVQSSSTTVPPTLDDNDSGDSLSTAQDISKRGPRHKDNKRGKKTLSANKDFATPVKPSPVATAPTIPAKSVETLSQPLAAGSGAPDDDNNDSDTSDTGDYNSENSSNHPPPPPQDGYPGRQPGFPPNGPGGPDGPGGPNGNNGWHGAL